MADRGRGRGRGRGGADGGLAHRPRGNDGGPGRGRGSGRGGRGDGGGQSGGDRGGQRGGGGFGPPRMARGDYQGNTRGRGGGGGVRGGDPGDRPQRGRPDAEPFQHGPAAIDPSIKKTEDAIVSGEKQLLAGSKGKLAPSHPHRPSYGTKGAPITLWANYFPMITKNVTLYRYKVEITRKLNPQPGPKRKRRMMEIFLDDATISQHKASIATDYADTILSTKNLDSVLDRKEFQVVFYSDGDDRPDTANSVSAADRDRKLYNLKITATGSLNTADLTGYLTSTQHDSWAQRGEDIIQALNIIVRHTLRASASVSNTGKGKHFNLRADASDRFNLGGGLEAIRGYFISVRPATQRLTLNIQVKNAAFYFAIPLSDLMRKFANPPGNHVTAIAKFVRKLSIDATHINKKNRAGARVDNVRSVHDVARTRDGSNNAGSQRPRVARDGAGPNDVQFHLSTENRWITVGEYFKKNYPQINFDPQLPVVNVGSYERPTYLIAEVCRVLPGQEAKTKLDPNQTANMIGFAVRRPHLNAQSIVSTGSDLLNVRNQTLSTFGVNITSHMTAVPGRVLSPPQLMYQKSQTMLPRFGSWNLSQNKLVETKGLTKWSWLRVSRRTEHCMTTQQQVEEVMKLFRATLEATGVHTAVPLSGRFCELMPGDNFAAKINDTVSRAVVNNLEFLIVILPERDNTQLYNQVKIACDVRHGLLNLCVQDTKFAKCNVDTFANISLKVNLKLGGRNHSVQPTRLPIVSEGKTMLVGLDVTHPSPGSKSDAPSVAAIVASVDQHLGQWPAAIGLLRSRQEMISQPMQSMFESRLDLWRRRNGRFPENIIVYRDGVSEGQYSLVLENELPEIRKACEKKYPANETKAGFPKISIIVVGKRHHTRFYVTSKDRMDRSGNPSSGTVVDRGITQAWLWDFFLQAHTAIQGTARPAHYYVIYDQIFRARQTASSPSADVLEELTHSLCYMFGRATKAVSLCPPAYYADIVAERARCYLHDQFDPDMSDTASVTSTATSNASNSSITIHPNVADKMFYT